MTTQTLVKPEEKKKFLSMDLAERLIRVEQSVSSSFNRFIPYDQTAYYKSMSESEKKEFDKFLKNKKKKKIIFSSSVVVSVFGLGIFGSGMTGNVIADTIIVGNISLMQMIFGGILGLLLLYGGYSFIKNRRNIKRFEKHTDIIDKFITNKRVVR